MKNIIKKALFVSLITIPVAQIVAMDSEIRKTEDVPAQKKVTSYDSTQLSKILSDCSITVGMTWTGRRITLTGECKNLLKALQERNNCSEN